LASGKGLVDIVSQFMNGFKASKDVENDKSLIVSLLGVLLEIILEFKNREIYDTFSLNLIKAGVFSPLINAILD